uniref:PID domain-containing protein n=1 Tax=Arion vulgaris TaxID=1028688 RepID=A0A0B7ATH1_9EUPU
MEGPSFYCAYLGFTALSKPPTNLSVLQSTVKELYFKYRKSPASGRSANLKLVQNGVLVVLYENGSVKSELFLDFSSVTFVEAAKFLAVKTSSERKPKAMFVPVDESKGAVSDKNAFLVDKIYHFLISSTHPPLVVCVVRRPTGVKALDCHVFALDTIENSLHISSLIASAQMPSGPMVKLDSGGDLARAKGGFDRGARGDVIRTDYGEYSVYRGPQNYDTPPSQR